MNDTSLEVDTHPAPTRALSVSNVRSVRLGHGANCSSVGSVVDTLYATAACGSAILAAILAALSREKVEILGGDSAGEPHGVASSPKEDP